MRSSIRVLRKLEQDAFLRERKWREVTATRVRQCVDNDFGVTVRKSDCRISIPVR